MNKKDVVRDFYGRMLGTVTTDGNGNKIARDSYGKLLGRYDKTSNITRDNYGRLIGRGDRCDALIPITKK